jgi:hypothetical protein
MEQARDVVGKIVEYWTEIQKPKTTVHTIVTVHQTQGSPSSGNVAASGDNQNGPGNPAPNVPGPTPSPAPSLPAGANRQLYERYIKAKGSARLGINDRNSLTNLWNHYISNLNGTARAKEETFTRLSTTLRNMGFNKGGLVSGYGSGDSIRAMLTPGEFVMTKPAVDAYGARMMKDINNGTFQSGSVYNYSISVNVETGANADQIANTVMRKIKSVDAKRIQGNRF